MNSKIVNRKSKISYLPLKLAILVIVMFGLLITGMVLWRPMWSFYYAAKMRASILEERHYYVKKLLGLNARERVFDYYTEQYASKDVEERMNLVDELCEYGDKGQAIMTEIFRNWCYSPSQQAKIPVGTLKLENGSNVEINSLYVDKFEVTLEKVYVYYKCTEDLSDRPENWKFSYDRRHRPRLPIANHPEIYISYYKSKAYADWLGMRLPTEYEWEYAARAGSTGKYCFGNNANLLEEYAWYKENSKYSNTATSSGTHSVGMKKPNEWGLYDVHGNATEWCTDAANRISVTKFLFGGGYNSPSTHCTSNSKRRVNDVSNPAYMLNTGHDIGFRCVRDVK
jgi:hypothetical protein